MRTRERRAMEPEDVEWVRRVQTGGPEAAAGLVARFGSRARRVAFGILGNLDDAEDAVQEAFLKAIARLDTYRGEAPLFVWITRIVVHCAHDALRRRRPVLPIEEAAAAASGPASDPSHVAQARDDLAHVRALLQELPPRPRTALVLKVIEEMSHREIAHALGTTEQSARVYVAQARRAIRRRLAGDAFREDEP